jgi:hypothetical protein
VPPGRIGPLVGVMDDVRHRRACKHAHFEPERGAGEPAHVGERLERARAAIEPAGAILVGAQKLSEARSGEQLHRSAPRAPLPCPRDHGLRRGGGMRGLDPAALACPAFDAVLRDQREDAIGGAAGEPHQSFAAVAPVTRDELVGIVLEARDDLPAVAAGGAITDVMRFEHGDLASRFGKRDRAREPRIAGTDHSDVGFNALFERACLRCERRRGSPERTLLIRP